MLRPRTLTLVFVFTEFANLSLGLKPGKSSAFSIHPPPPPVGPQKSPGNTMGRTSVSGPSSQSHEAGSSLLSTCPPWLGSITVTQAKSLLPMGEDVYAPSTLVPCSNTQQCLQRWRLHWVSQSPGPSPLNFPIGVFDTAPPSRSDMTGPRPKCIQPWISLLQCGNRVSHS